jgi:hypothetical protein
MLGVPSLGGLGILAVNTVCILCGPQKEFTAKAQRPTRNAIAGLACPMHQNFSPCVRLLVILPDAIPESWRCIGELCFS